MKYLTGSMLFLALCVTQSAQAQSEPSITAGTSSDAPVDAQKTEVIR